METLKELAKKIDFSFKHGALRPYKKQDDWQRKSNGYRITLRYHGKRMTLDFWQGSGIKDDPSAEGVMDCLLSDASCAQDSYKDFCGNCGYEEDSRKAYGTYRQIMKQTERLKNLLGSEFEAFLYAERD